MTSPLGNLPLGNLPLGNLQSGHPQSSAASTSTSAPHGAADHREWWATEATLSEALAHGLTESEFSGITKSLGRPVNLLELGICAALFSEHCSYKSTKVHLRNLPSAGPRVLQGPGENAGVLDIGDGEAVVFKVESHNHPSFIEPFQGAATGVGGILRDIFTMGARPLALMNGLRFGEPTLAKTRQLLSRAVQGIGGYGNCVGVPTVAGELFFDKSFNGNCLVNAFALGVADHDGIFLGNASGVGNPVLYFGAKTGRDGIRGAIMASAGFEDDSEEKRPTVQVGDPFTEKLLIEASLAIMKSGAVVGIQDMGAAGMTCACYEMAERAGTGLRVNLDAVPQREHQMNPYEIMLSESQERMLCVVHKGREQEVLDILHRWELDAVTIGEVTEGTAVRLFWHDECVSEMPVALVTAAVPQYRWPESAPTDLELKNTLALEALSEPTDLATAWLHLLSSVNSCSRRPVFEQYDSTVRTNTVVHPGGDAGVIRIKRKAGVAPTTPEKGIAMSLDCNSRYCSIHPHQGTALSLAEAVRNLAAVGATPIGLSDCLNFGSPQRPESMWQIAQSIRGLAEAARAFEIPIISGNVSLYNETKGEPVMPTPMLATVGLMPDASKAIGATFTQAGDTVLLLGKTNPDEIGGSEYLAVQFGMDRGPLPRLDYDAETRSAALVRDLITEGLLHSAHDLSAGGLATALAECCFGTKQLLGCELTLSDAAAIREKGNHAGALFAESGARYLLSCSKDNAATVQQRTAAAGVSVGGIGRVGGEQIAVIGVASIPLAEAYQGWRNGLTGLIL